MSIPMLPQLIPEGAGPPARGSPNAGSDHRQTAGPLSVRLSFMDNPLDGKAALASGGGRGILVGEFVDEPSPIG
jgi:hypothetical protein